MGFKAGWVLLIHLFFIVKTTTAQSNALAAIRKIYSAYNTDYVMRFSGSMKMYKSNSPSKIIERTAASYLLKAGSFRCSIGPVDMLMNERYYVSVDRSVKIIIV